MKEASKLGFATIVAPSPGDAQDTRGIRLSATGHVADLVASIASRAPRRERPTDD